MDASYGREIYYEESAIPNKAKKKENKYKIVNIVANIFLTIGILAIFFGINFVPIDAWILWGIICLWFFSVWFVLFKVKARINVSYDYVFVSGELRISKVININKRKLVTRFDCEEILQLGDVDSQSYELLKTDPTNKEVICTPNYEALEGKFFMYIHVNDNGKKLYILECREQMLINILKFAKRTTLAKDYVMQEKKQK